MAKKEIQLVSAQTIDQSANFLSKSGTKKQLLDVLSKVGIIDIYAPA